MKACPSGKKGFSTESLAIDALIDANIRYEYPRGDGPVAIYRCEDCGQYHLTSRGPEHARLTECRNNGSLARSKEAYHWTTKLKK